MPRCSFCGDEIERGTGKTLIQRDATILNFCSNKCEKNLLKLKRKPLKVKWTRQSRKARGKLKPEEMAVVVEEKKAKKEAKRATFVDEGAKEKAEEKPEEKKEKPEEKPKEEKK